jgi:predicted RNA-binding Zn ribbon-like protein
MRRTLKQLRDSILKLPAQTRRIAGRLRELRPAPGDLRIVQEFLNTADLDAGIDELTSPQALADWMALHALLPTGTELDATDVERTIAFRESLRSLVAAGESAGRKLGAAVDRAASGALLRVRFEAGGELRLEPVAPGIDGAIGRLLAIVAAAQRDGLWARFKACVNGSCRAAFYDYSTNRSGLWCLPRCGSRIRARDFRRRKRRSGLNY